MFNSLAGQLEGGEGVHLQSIVVFEGGECGRVFGESSKEGRLDGAA